MDDGVGEGKATDPNRRWWKDKGWYDGLFADANRMFTFETEGCLRCRWT